MFQRLLTSLLLGAVVLPPAISVPAATRAAATSSWLQGWPMDGHDPQRTNRSPVVGPTRPRLLFTRKATSIRLIGPDGSMYGFLLQKQAFTAASFGPRGKLRHRYRPSEPPAGLLLNGMLLAMGADSGRLLAFSKTGKLLWKNQSIGLPKSAQPVVGEDNRFYALFEGHPEDGSAGLDIFTTRGKRRRVQPGRSFFAAAVAAAGTVYALTYVHDTDASFVQAIMPSGRVRWRHPLRISLEAFGSCHCLLLGQALYVTDGNDVVGYSLAGAELWRFHKRDGALAVAERGDGSLLVAGNDTLDALAPDGTVLWTLDIRAPGSNPYYKPTLILDGAGKAYVGAPNGQVRIVGADGRLVGAVSGPSRYGISPTCLLAPNGHLIVDGPDGAVRIYG